MPFDFNGNGSAGGRGSNVSGTGSQGFQDTGSTSARGFQNTPERKNPKSSPGSFQTLSAPGRREAGYLGRTGRPRQRRPSLRREIKIPWRSILMIAGILILVAALWVNRDAISAFLSQVLSWVITILVIIFLVKIFIFRR